MAEDLDVASHVTQNGMVVRTQLRGERYVTEVFYDRCLIGKAENIERFWAGFAHAMYFSTWGDASESNLKQAAWDARQEGYGPKT